MPTTESVTSEFGFHVEYVDNEDQVVRVQRLTASDFAHAIRHTQFDALRCGQLTEYLPRLDGARIEPVFPNGDDTSPRTKGFSVAIPLENGTEHRCDFDISYFKASANRLRADLLRTKEMSVEQELYYRLNAYLDDEEPVRPKNKLAISLDAPIRGIATTARARADLGASVAWDDPGTTELPAVIDHSVLEEAVEEAKSDPENEIAGFLLGHVHSDPATREVYVAVTGLASAQGTTAASGTSVTFTPASFAQARSIIALRGTDEMVVGWYHSHPFKFCGECPLPTPPECIAKVLFYSLDDIHLMETTFEQPFMVGLLAAIEPRIETAIGHLPVKLYGWCGGEIKERGFEVVGMTND